MPNPVVHFEATGKDGNKLRNFYGETFGWKFDVMQPMDYGMVDNGGRGINGGVGTGSEATSTVYIEVPDLQAALDAVGSAGGKTMNPPMEIPGVVSLAHFTDPEGNMIGLVKANPENAAMPPSSAPEAANPVTWFEIIGKDGAALRNFYSRAFGWTFDLMPGDMDYGTLKDPGRGISGGIGTGESGYGTFTVEVPDPQAALDAAEAAGGKTTVPVTEIPGVVTFAMLADPEGNLVGIFKGP